MWAQQDMCKLSSTPIWSWSYPLVLLYWPTLLLVSLLLLQWLCCSVSLCPQASLSWLNLWWVFPTPRHQCPSWTRGLLILQSRQAHRHNSGRHGGGQPERYRSSHCHHLQQGSPHLKNWHAFHGYLPHPSWRSTEGSSWRLSSTYPPWRTRFGRTPGSSMRCNAR